MVAKKTEPTAKKNMARYESYKLAWEIIKPPVDVGATIGAIAVEESIIKDRLFSFVSGRARVLNLDLETDLHIGEKVTDRASGFYRVIVATKLILKHEGKKGCEADQLMDRIDVWKNGRNECVHTLALGTPGKPVVLVKDFVKKVVKCADEGRKLAREVDSWHKKELNAHRKNCKD